MKKDKSKIVLIAGVFLILVSFIAYLKPWEKLADAETTAWQLTLVDSEGCEKTLSFKDITSLPAYMGNGGFFSTVGTVYGPYAVKGVTLEELCKQVGGMAPGDAVMISAKDGYSTVLTYEQVMGEFITYDTDLREAPHGELKTILMYELEGKPLSDEAGKPLRLAVVGFGKGLLTEGNYWVKWVNKIEILKAP